MDALARFHAVLVGGRVVVVSKVIPKAVARPIYEIGVTPTKPILHAYNSPVNFYSLKAIVFPVWLSADPSPYVIHN
jgi:phenolic acid decarboxylase